jgi:hypothetical protein
VKDKTNYGRRLKRGTVKREVKQLREGQNKLWEEVKALREGQEKLGRTSSGRVRTGYGRRSKP